MKRIPELDGIRGVAISLVLLFHYVVLLIHAKPASPLAYVLALGRLTWTGVDLFFVLSGFLIGGILLDARDSPNYFQTFYVRRFFRIVPLYLVWFALTLTVLHLAEGGRFSAALNEYILRDRFTMLPYIAYLQNFWETARNTLGWYSNGGTWSLAIEEQFYLTLPFVIRFASRRVLPWLLGTAIVGATAVRLAIYFFAPHHREGIFVLMPSRMDALLLGVLGAMVMRDDRLRGRLNPRAMLVALAVFTAGAAVLTKSAAEQTGLAMSAGAFTWMAALYLCAILFAVTQPKSALAAALRWRWLRWMGTIAYGVYLLHFQVLLGVYAFLWARPPDRLASVGEITAVILSAALTIAICTASWLYFEKPLVDFAHRFDFGVSD